MQKKYKNLDKTYKNKPSFIEGFFFEVNLFIDPIYNFISKANKVLTSNSICLPWTEKKI